MLKFTLNSILSIRILRSDNVKEYFFTSFSSFMFTHWILYQSSCAYTPQQNGVAERKNRHLVETTRTLLIHHKVPQHFWGGAILAACYLINRMSSSVLHDQIPHSILLSNQPLFCLPPRVFGCLFCSYSHFWARQTLNQSHKMCLLGLFLPSEGLPLLFSRHYFISVDATFFENSSFFSSATHPSVPDVLSIPLVLPSPNFSSPPTDVVTRPLQVYTRRPRTPIGPLVDPSSMSQSPPDPVPQPSADPPFAIRKGTRSTSNPHLFIIFSAFLAYLYLTLPLFPPCLLSLPLKALVRLSLI